MGWKYWMFRLGGPLIIALSVFPVLSGSDIIAVVFGALAFFVPEIVMWGTLRQAKGDKETRLRLTDEGLSADVSGAATTFEWAAFRMARETRDFWLLRRYGGVNIPVPKGPLSAEQVDQVRTLLRENGLLR
jgi:hypothetical protein